MEYMVKFNLQKHLEQCHTPEERNTSAEELIKVSSVENWACLEESELIKVNNISRIKEDLQTLSLQKKLEKQSKLVPVPYFLNIEKNAFIKVQV